MGGDIIILAPALVGCAVCAAGWWLQATRAARLARRRKHDLHHIDVLEDCRDRLADQLADANRKLKAGGRAAQAKRRQKLAELKAERLAQLKREIANV